MAVPSDNIKRSTLKAWARAPERTAGIERGNAFTLPELIDALAIKRAAAPAMLARESGLTYQALAATCNRYARWAVAKGLAHGHTVCLVKENRPKYAAVWLGLSRIGDM